MEFNVTVHCLPALTYIDPDDVEDCFDELCENPLLPDDLVQYFLKNYIGEWHKQEEDDSPLPKGIVESALAFEHATSPHHQLL